MREDTRSSSLTTPTYTSQTHTSPSLPLKQEGRSERWHKVFSIDHSYLHVADSHVSISATETGRQEWEMTQGLLHWPLLPTRRRLTRLHLCHWNRKAWVRDDACSDHSYLHVADSHVSISATETGRREWEMIQGLLHWPLLPTRRRLTRLHLCHWNRKAGVRDDACSDHSYLHVADSHVSISATETGRWEWEMTQTPGDEALPQWPLLPICYRLTRLHLDSHWNRDGGERWRGHQKTRFFLGDHSFLHVTDSHVCI